MMMSETTMRPTRAGIAVRERLTARRLAVMLTVLLLTVVVLLIVAVTIGSESVKLVTILKIMVAEVSGRAVDVSPENHLIIARIRLPRALMAMVVGAGLAVAGAAYQALLKNPLADPAILGVSSGGALGAIAAMIFAGSLPISRPIAAFIGAMITTAFVYALGQSRQGDSSIRLILAGVITNALLSSIVIFLVTTAAGARQRSVISWLIGDMGGETALLPLVALFVLMGIAVIYINARSLNLLMVSELDAFALGVEVNRVKLTVYIAASLITGATVAVSGAIGFVGLIIPHAMRLVGGSDNRLIIPASALAGGAFLLLADTIARTVIAPLELPIGVITALVGAPVFIYLLWRTS